MRLTLMKQVRTAGGTDTMIGKLSQHCFMPSTTRPWVASNTSVKTQTRTRQCSIACFGVFHTAVMQ
jgi:hypothetical protein